MNYGNAMKIWIDIVNSPHVLFFKPIIEELTKRGHSVSITAREYAQTTGLLDEFKMPYTLIGAHAGAKLSKKLIGVLRRSSQLVSYSKNRRFDLALTFNSASLVVAAAIQRIASMVFMDYEYQPLNHLTFRLTDKVVIPQCFPDEALTKFNAVEKAVKYEGLKEQVYLSDFRTYENPLQELNIDSSKVVVIARPPATMALYHRFENDLFYDVIEHLLKDKKITMIAFPRSKEQKMFLESFGYTSLFIPPKPVDNRSLLHHTDLVISAGGTMNREAGVMGVPAYTVFKGMIGAADRYLIDLGRIIPINSKEDISKIAVRKIEHNNSLVNTNVKRTLINIILNQ